MLGLLVLVAVFVFRMGGADGLAASGEDAVRLLLDAAPFIVLGIGLAGMLTVLVPPSAVARLMGDEAGLKGLVIAVVAGALSPGGPYVVYPIAAAMMSSGAGLGPMAGFLAMRNTVSVQRLLVWDLPFLGLPFAVARSLAGLWFPLVAIVMVPLVFRLMPAAAREAATAKLDRVSKVARGPGREGTAP